MKETGTKKTDKNQKIIFIKEKLDRHKRKLYLAGVIMMLILAALFISQGRWLRDLMPASPVNNPLPLSERGDISGLETVLLGSGTFTAGTDIPPGRYMATTEDGFGSFVVYEPDTDYVQISEVLGYHSETAHVPAIALTLTEGQRIEIKKLKEVIFTPLPTKFLTELTAGIWEAGLDVSPGTYTISSKDGLSGVVTVFSGNEPVARFRLGKHGNNYRETDTVTLKEGQTISISGIPTVIFDKHN